MSMDEEMAWVPESHRKTFAKWLLERAERYQPSMFLDEIQANLLKDVLTGVAVDVVDPMSEDMTNAHAARVLGELRA